MRDAIELFAGSGILGKAARDVGLVDSVRVQVEIDPYCRRVLERRNRMIGNGICYPVALAICGAVAEVLR